VADESKDLVPAKSGADAALELAGIVSSLVPWLGGPISNVLGGISVDRKIGRLREALEGLAQGLKDFKSKASEEYAKTEDFGELLGHALRRVIDERSEEKRRIYRDFLVDAIKSPGELYDEQLRFLKTLEEIQPDHIRILRVLNNPPDVRPSSRLEHTIPRLQGLSLVLLDIPYPRMVDLVDQLNSMLLTKLTDEDDALGLVYLPSTITPYGHRFMKFITD